MNLLHFFYLTGRIHCCSLYSVHARICLEFLKCVSIGIVTIKSVCWFYYLISKLYKSRVLNLMTLICEEMG